MKKIIAVIIFAIILFGAAACNSQQQGNQFSVGIERMRQGVTSAPLYFGKEQLIRFDSYTGAHIYLTKDEVDEAGLCHIIGNIDFVVMQSDQKNDCEEFYTVLRNQFALMYRKEEGVRKIERYQVQSLPGSTYVEILEQFSQSEVQAQDILTLEKPLVATLHVSFRDTQWNIPADYTWQCEFTLDQSQNVVLSLKPCTQETLQQ